MAQRNSPRLMLTLAHLTSLHGYLNSMSPKAQMEAHPIDYLAVAESRAAGPNCLQLLESNPSDLCAYLVPCHHHHHRPTVTIRVAVLKSMQGSE